MAIVSEVVADKTLNVSTGTPIAHTFPMFAASDLVVYYGVVAPAVAEQNVDYTYVLAVDFQSFTVTPTASLLAKIDALILADPTNEINYITVRRDMDNLTPTTPASVRQTQFASTEFDRTAMRFQQLQDNLNRALTLSPNFVGDAPKMELTEALANASLVFDATASAIVTGPTVTEVANAQGYAAEALVSKNAAGVSEAKAQDWAQESEDTPVETGPNQFSALHHAVKAAASAALLPVEYTTVDLFLSSAEASRGVFAIWRGGDKRFEEAAGAVTDHDESNAAGVKFYDLQKRTARAAAVLASQPDGYIGFLSGFPYVVDSSATGSASCTNDLSVDGLVPFDKLGVYIDQYGAVGDGVTDNTAAIQASLDHQLVRGITAVPDGTYIVGGTLTCTSSSGTPQNLNLRGVGSKSIISFTGGGKFTLNKSDQDQWYVRDLTFQSDGNAATYIEMKASFIELSGCQLKGFDTALRVGGYYQKIDMCFFEGNTIGIEYVGSTFGYNSNTISNCLFASHDQAIVLVNDDSNLGYNSFFLSNVTIRECTFETYDIDAIFLDNASNVSIENCWLEDTAAPINGIRAINYCKGLKVSNAWSQQTATWTVKLDGNCDAIIRAGRGQKFTVANSSSIYFTDQLSGQVLNVTKDATSNVFYSNLRVNGAEEFFSLTRGVTAVTPDFQNHGTNLHNSNANIRWSYDGVPHGFIAATSKSGTIGSFTAMTNGNTLGAMLFGGSGATKLLLPAQVSGAAHETFTDTSAASAIQFWTTPPGSINPVRRLELQPAGHLYPYADNAYNLGGASNRWKEVFAGNATINTSDANMKQQIEKVTATELKVAKRLKGLIRSFKFNDAVEAKGGKARKHFGVIAQEVKAAFEAEGLVAEEYALLCYDEWPERAEVKSESGDIEVGYRPAGSAYGIRYEELTAFILSALL